MIGGVFIVLVAIWMYQAAVKAQKDNALLWVVIGCIVFFAVQFAVVKLNATVAETMMSASVDKGPAYAGELYNRTGPINSQSSGGVRAFFLFLLVEILPPFLGVVGAGLVRSIFVLKEKVTLKNLFGGIKEMFIDIGRSFKTSQQ